MDPTNFDVFDPVEKRMHWLDQRDSLLAQDIANSNTPNFAFREDQLGKPIQTSNSQDLAAHLYYKYKSMFELVLGRSS